MEGGISIYEARVERTRRGNRDNVETRGPSGAIIILMAA